MKKFFLIFLLALLAGMPAHAITVSSCSFNNPNADRFFGWDQSQGKCNIFTPGSGLVFSGTNVSVSGLTVSEFSSPNISQWTNNAGYLAGLGSSSINDLSDINLTGLTDGELLVSSSGIFINNTLAEAGIAAASHVHPASDINSGTFANARISQGSVTQHQAALSLTASQISDFDAVVADNTDVSANTSARHAAASVTDSSEIDFTLTVQNITASLKNGSIDEARLDTSTNISLDLADSSLQPGDNISDLANDEGYITDLSGFTTSDLADSTNKRYVTDAHLTILGNTSGTNTGDQTNITGNAGTATALAANPSNCSAGQFPLGINASGVPESCTALPTTISGTANEITASASTGVVTISLASSLDLGSKSLEIPNSNALPGSCTTGQIFLDTDATSGQQLYGCESGSYILQGDGGGSGGIGSLVEDTTPQLGGDLDLNGFTVGDATDADLTKLNDLTATSTELNYAVGVTSLLQDQLDGKQPLDSDLTTISGLTATTDNFIQSKAGAWASRTIAQVKSDLGLTGTNSGDQTSIVGINGTKAQFDTAVTDGNFLYVGDITQYTDELARDAINATLSTAFTSSDAGDTIALTSHTIGNVAYDGTANIVPETTAIIDTTDTTASFLFVDSATGNLQHKTDAGAAYDASTGTATFTAIVGTLTGNSSTATAGFANGGNCSSGSAALGVDTAWAAEGCFDVWSEAENTAAAYAPKASPIFTGIVTLPSAAAPTTDADGEIAIDLDAWGSGFDAIEIWNGTASAYVPAITASDTCTNGQIPKFNTSGEWTCENDAGGGVPTTITVADTTDSTSFCALFESATGDLGPKTDGGCLYAADTGTLSSTVLSTANLTLTGTGTLTDLDALAGSTEATIEAQVFDADAKSITGVWEWQDDIDLAFGNDADWSVNYDESVDDQLLWLTAKTATAAIGDPLFEIIGGAAATTNQQYFGVSKGTQASNTELFTVDEDGDGAFPGTVTATGGFVGNASTATALATARAIGNVNFDGTAAITPEQTAIVDSSDASSFLAMYDSATGNLQGKTDPTITANPTNGTVTATTFSGALSGNSTTATALAANGANCPAGQYPLGVDASGAVESCTAASGDWVRLGSTTASASATLDFTSLISSAYENYVFVLNDIRLATDGQNLTIRTSTDNGGAFSAAAGNYQYSGNRSLATGTGTATNTAVGTDTATSIFIASTVNNAAADAINGTVYLYNPLGTVTNTRITSNMAFGDDTNQQNVFQVMSGERLATADVDALRFISTSGNITSGKIIMYGIKP